MHGHGGRSREGSSSAGSPGAAGTTGAGGTTVTGAAGSTSSGTGGSGGIRPVVTNPPAFQPAPGMLRRLTRTQFRNAVRDVFGVEVNIATLDPDS